MNRVQLIGALVWPVRLWRSRATGRALGKAMLAVPTGELGLTFVPVILQGQEAVDAEMYLGEGSRIAITGYLRSAITSDRPANGSIRNRRVVQVIATHVTYLTVLQHRSGDRP